MNNRPKVCLDCHVEFVPRSDRHSYKGRGLCRLCYFRALRGGTLEHWPRLGRGGRPLRVDVVEDVDWLARTGESVDRWRDRLGYAGQVASLARLLRKHGRYDLARKLAPLVHRERTAA